MKKEYDEAINAIIEALLIDPEDETLWYYLGLAYSLKKERRKADHAHWRVKFPFEFHSHMDRLLLSAKLELSYAYFQKNQCNMAIDICEKIIAQYPGYVRAILFLSYIYINKEEYTKATSMCNLALEVDPENITALNNLGCIFNSKTEYNKAIEVLHRALNKAPKSSHSLNHIGLAYYKIGEIEKGISYIKRSIGLDSKYQPAHDNLAMIYQELGRELVEENKMNVVPESIAKKKSNLKSFYKLAKFLYYTKNFEDCATACRKCLEYSPSDKKALKLLSKANKTSNYGSQMGLTENII